EIEQTRLGDRLRVQIEIAPETLGAKVPNLILQPLVENAIRHGIAPHSAPGEITVRGERHNGALRLQGRNTSPALHRQRPSTSEKGIGLLNTRSRLEQLYGGRQSFEVLSNSPEGFTVNITIPFSDQAHSATDTSKPNDEDRRPDHR